MAIYSKDNPFYKMITGEIKVSPVYEDDLVLAINDLYPQAPVHILFIPKGEYLSFDDFIVKAKADEVVNFFKIIQKIAVEKGLSENGYRLVMNHKASVGQSVFHFHVHLLSNLASKQAESHLGLKL
ncbi:HIT domain-containing protein [Rickettsiales endosymbiont of Stachyamoeba lipophora]|uniref:HIT domain-containing protein n=1 Tax=Rickettsiales endosymbiont of Stachyamoeba lipophora TaxID=2486578 RepID=UPI000F64C35F|nr:HIT domain-containing protein [Rickettsiales endosymbiont of Stachyamoeba lipophora]AZL16210.1 HIT domain-containing protein [Rickettsiales endosymbiont of Stachyamoeba lipophora]